METVVCYRHKERKLLVDMKYIKEHLGKTITFIDWSKPLERYDYKVEEIPFSEDWEIEVRYFKPEEVNNLLRGCIDRKLYDRLQKIVDYPCGRNLNEE